MKLTGPVGSVSVNLIQVAVYSECRSLVKDFIMCTPFDTCFVGVLCNPGNGDATNFRVTESQEECPIGFGQKHILCLLLVHKTQDGPTTGICGVIIGIFVSYLMKYQILPEMH